MSSMGEAAARAQDRLDGSSDPDFSHVTYSPLRWLVIGVFGLSSILNFLDRQLLAATAPSLKTEFGLSNAQYGALVSAFSFAYMLASPVAGMLIDRFGLRLSMSVSVALWSAAGALTSIARGFASFTAVRIGLGMAEGSGIPGSSKASATYLPARELGLGNAVQSIDITIGAIAAPLVVGLVAPIWGWRSVFLVSGLLGVLWIPLWWFVSSKVPRTLSSVSKPRNLSDIIGDRRIWAIVLSSSLVMTVQSLWMNWTTIYLVQEHALSQAQANSYFAWIPPIFGSLGGLAGGTAAFFLIRTGESPLRGRKRACLLAGPLLLVTIAIPFISSTWFAIGAVCVSLFAAMMVLINLHIMPIDLFGVQRAAFVTAIMVSSFALMQVLISPIIGALMDRSSFSTVCFAVSAFACSGVIVLAKYVHE
jgi:ACS family hexuronate transporter-like MFS transporter